MLANHYMTPPSVFHVWSAPEIPHSDGYPGLYYQTPFERTASSVDNSPLQSPTVNSCHHATSPPNHGSPFLSKISSEIPVARRESSTQATVHPLPLPPGAGLPSQLTPVSSVASASDFSVTSVPSQPNITSNLTAKPEIGANINAEPSPISQVAVRRKLMPIKSKWQKGKLIGRGTFGSVYVASNRFAWINILMLF